MKPILFEKDATDFSTQGIGTLSDIITGTVTEELNGTYEAEITYPISGRYFNELRKDRIVLMRHDDSSDLQPFRIYKVSKPISGVSTINLEHISYELKKMVVRPFDASSCPDFFNKIASYIIDPPHAYTFTTDISLDKDFSFKVPKTVRGALGGSDKSVLDICGYGEFVFNNRNVAFKKNRGVDSGVTIRYGKNLTDLTYEVDATDEITGIVPYYSSKQQATVIAEDGTETTTNEDVLKMLPDYVVTRKDADKSKIIPVDLTSEFDEEPTDNELEAAAATYLATNGKSTQSLTISFIALWQTEEYKNVASLQRLFLGDKAEVDYYDLGVNVTAEITKTVFNVLSERYDSMELGDIKSNLSQTLIDSTDNAIDEAANKLTKTISDFADEYNAFVIEQTNKILGGTGGHVVVNRDSNGNPNEILVMDTDNKATAVDVIRINKAGIGFSQHGYNGPYATAWTIDSKFNADYILAGTIRANLIKAGILSDKSGKNFWNMETGEFSLQAYSTTDETKKAIKDAADGLVSSVDVLYAIGTAEKPIGEWDTKPPARAAGYHIWSKTRTARGNDITDTTPVDITGADGTSVKVVQIDFAEGDNGTTAPTSGWQLTVPNVPQGKWLWCRTQYSDDTSACTCSYIGTDGADGNSVAVESATKSDGVTTIIIKDTTGKETTLAIKDGKDGATGKKGEDGKSVHIAWANSEDGTADFSTTNSTDKKYLGVYLSDANADDKNNDSKNPADYSWSLIKGKDGTSVRITKIEYAISTTGDKYPSSGWQTDIPSVAQGQWLWSKITYSDKSVDYNCSYAGTDGADGTSVTLLGTSRDESKKVTNIQLSSNNMTYHIAIPDGKDGENGQKGEDGKSIHIAWATAPDGSTGFSTTDGTDKTYLGVYANTDSGKDSNNPADYSWSRIRGTDGKDGVAGKNGNGITSTIITYGISDSDSAQPSSYSDQVPELTKGKYLWTKTVWTYTDKTTETGYQKTYIAKDGNDGNDGNPGKDGVGIESTTIDYASSSSGEKHPSSGWQKTVPAVTAGNYLWTRMTWTYTDKTTETGYSVAKMGETGTGVSQISEEYFLSTSQVSPQGGKWENKQPKWTNGHYIWTRSKITWSNGKTTYTNPVLAEAINAANSAAFGGNNILNGSSAYREGTPFSIDKTTANDSFCIIPNMYANVTPGVTYMFQLKTDAPYSTMHGYSNTSTNNTIGKFTAWFYLRKTALTGFRDDGYDMAVCLNTEGAAGVTHDGNTHYWKYTIPDGYKSLTVRVNTYADANHPVTAKFWDFKLEKGETATDYTPPIDDYTRTVVFNDLNTQKGIFNKLTNNGATQGIYLKDGKVYINGTYIATGAISDTKGLNTWNLNTGEFKINTLSNLNTSNLIQGTLDGWMWGGGVSAGQWSGSNPACPETNGRGFALPTNSDGSWRYSSSKGFVLRNGMNYTLSYYNTAYNCDTILNVRTDESDSKQWTSPVWQAAPNNGGAWVRHVINFKCTKTGTYYCIIGNKQISGLSAGNMALQGLKLEQGNLATGWTPHPEDLEAHVAITRSKDGTASLIAEAPNLHFNASDRITVNAGSKILYKDVDAIRFFTPRASNPSENYERGLTKFVEDVFDNPNKSFYIQGQNLMLRTDGGISNLYIDEIYISKSNSENPRDYIRLRDYILGVVNGTYT